MLYQLYDSMDTVGLFREGFMEHDEALRRLTQDNGWDEAKARRWLLPATVGNSVMSLHDL